MFLINPFMHGAGSPVIPPSILASDPYYANNTILLLGNGAAAGTVVMDQLANLWTVNGGLTTDGSGALSFNGTNSEARCTRTGALGTGDFSVEGRVLVSSLASDGLIFCISNSSHALNSFDFLLEWKTSGAIRASIQNGSGTVNVDVTSAGSVLAAGNTYDFSVDVTGTTLRIRINGAVVGTGTITGTRVQNQTQCRIGMLSSSTGFPRWLNGKIYWLRVTAGQVRNAGSGTVTAQSDPPPSIAAPRLVSGGFTTGSTNDSQGIADDGTYLYYSSSTTLYKYNRSGVLQTSRNASGDNPTSGAIPGRQLNGLHYDTATGKLWASVGIYNTVVAEAYISEYNPSTFAFVSTNQVTGDWFSESMYKQDGYWWMSFHAHKTLAKVDPTSFAVAGTYSLTFSITGSSGGYGGTQGYESATFIPGTYYFICPIHDTYNEKYWDVYYFNGTSADKVCRWARPATGAHQGICFDPGDATTIWAVVRSGGGSDSLVKLTLT